MKKDLSRIMSLDIFLASLDTETYRRLEKHIQPEPQAAHPLMSRDLSGLPAGAGTEMPPLSEREVLETYRRQFGWDVYLDSLLGQPYTAIVLTDLHRTILWTNKGFTEMTGYSRRYAVGKKPSFLQGKDTDPKALRRIRRKLGEGKPFTEILLNYRKNKESYFCEVSVTQLVDRENRVTHFIALEKEIP